MVFSTLCSLCPLGGGTYNEDGSVGVERHELVLLCRLWLVLLVDRSGALEAFAMTEWLLE